MSDRPIPDTLQTLLAALGSNDPAQRRHARQQIRDALAADRKSWNDLVQALQFRGKHGDKLKKLFAMLGQHNDGEFDNARQKLSAILAGEKRTWKSFVDALFYSSTNGWCDWHINVMSPGNIDAVAVVHHLLHRYVSLTEYQAVAVALWVIHTFVCHRFTDDHGGRPTIHQSCYPD